MWSLDLSPSENQPENSSEVSKDPELGKNTGLYQQIKEPETANKGNKVNEDPYPILTRITKPSNSDREKRKSLRYSINNGKTKEETCFEAVQFKSRNTDEHHIDDWCQ